MLIKRILANMVTVSFMLQFTLNDYKAFYWCWIFQNSKIMKSLWVFFLKEQMKSLRTKGLRQIVFLSSVYESCISHGSLWHKTTFDLLLNVKDVLSLISRKVFQPLLGAVLCIVGYLAASLASVHYMSAASPALTTKRSLDVAKCFLQGKITTRAEPLR